MGAAPVGVTLPAPLNRSAGRGGNRSWPRPADGRQPGSAPWRPDTDPAAAACPSSPRLPGQGNNTTAIANCQSYPTAGLVGCNVRLQLVVWGAETGNERGKGCIESVEYLITPLGGAPCVSQSCPPEILYKTGTHALPIHS